MRSPGIPPIREIVPPETYLAFPLLAELFGLPDETRFVERVDRELRPDGYRLVGTFPEGEWVAAAIAGFRLVRSEAWGDHIYVDDLAAGHPAPNLQILALMYFIRSEAKRLDVTQIHLDVIREESRPEFALGWSERQPRDPGFRLRRRRGHRQ